MSIESLTIGEAREIANLFGNKSSAYRPHPLTGKNVIVRTITMIYTGKLVGNDEFGLHLNQAAWIPDTGRYANFVAEGEADECEPYPEDLIVFVSPGALIEVVELKSNLPRSQK